MTSPTEINPDALVIDKFIFHVIHQKDKAATLLKETPIGDFHDFFVERVCDTLKGNRFVFEDGSQTKAILSMIGKSGYEFLEGSKQLAINFHALHNDNIKPGVFILMQLSHDDEKIFSIIKYDHERVLTYKYIESEGKALLEEVVNSFTKSKQALHKSAIIRIDKDMNEVVVVDRTVGYDITKFFKGFLNVVRKYTNIEMTKELYDAIIETNKVHKDMLPKEITTNIRSLALNALNATDIYENSDDIVTKVFGASANDNVKKTFSNILKKKDIDGESFKPDTSKLPRPKKLKVKTEEGVLIEYSESNSTLVKFDKPSEDGFYTISVKTKKYCEM